MYKQRDYRYKIHDTTINAIKGDVVAFDFLVMAVNQGKHFWKTRTLTRKTWVKIVDVHRMSPTYDCYSLKLSLLNVLWLSIVTRSEKLQNAWGHELSSRYVKYVERRQSRHGKGM
jgi:hypothetical protein